MNQSAHPRDAFARVFGTSRGPTRREVERQRELGAQRRADRAAEMKAIVDSLEEHRNDLPRGFHVLDAAVIALVESNLEMPSDPSEQSPPWVVRNFLTDPEYRHRVMFACTNQAAIDVFGRGDTDNWFDQLSEIEQGIRTEPLIIRMGARSFDR